MNRKTLEKEIKQFKDDLKEYQEVVRDIWGERNNRGSDEITAKLKEEREIPLREKLIENFGKLERYFIKIGVPMEASKMGRSIPIFDNALDEQLFNNPIKGQALSLALQMATKAMGIIKSLDDKEFRKLERRTITVFVSYNFSKKNKEITQKFIDFISKFNVAISLGSEIDTVSISEKVKSKIDDADIVVAIITKDEQDDKGVWSPSKWVIEELAYSLASKDKKIVRLLEKGCNTNGRIFGDKEYISFDRGNPVEAFIKLAEVLNKKTA